MKRKLKQRSSVERRVAILVLYTVSLAVQLSFGLIKEARGFSEPDLLNRRIRPTEIKNQTIDQVLSLLAIDYKIPIGIELADEKLAPGHKITLNVPETNLKDFLSSVVAKDTRYNWKLEGGVIHFSPVTGRDALIAALLDTKISHFAFAEGSSRYSINNDIMNIPEIRAQLVVADVAPMIFLNGASMQRVGKGVALNESGITLKELLDQIVLKTEFKRWTLGRWGKDNEFITLTS
jgi:hypothetical protein